MRVGEVPDRLDGPGSWGFLSSIIDTLPSMVFVKAATDLRFVLLNRAGEELLGYSRQELLGKSDHDFFPQQEADFFVARDREVLASGALLDIPEEAIQTRHQGTRILHTQKMALLGADGQPRYLLGLSTDITERKRMEQELAAASAARTEFLSRVSHELRTPLTAIIGFTELLKLESPRPDQMAALDAVDIASRHLQRLVDDVLDLTRDGTGSLDLESRPVSVSAVVAEAVEMLGPVAEGQGVTVSVDVDDVVAVMADAQRLRQILLNLLSNAIKYNSAGGHVTVTAVATEERVRVSVIDDGPGLSGDDLKLLFVPFQRLALARDNVPGVGLGLVLARTLAEAMGGSVDVRSAVGRGSTFWVELVAAAAPGGRRSE